MIAFGLTLTQGGCQKGGINDNDATDAIGAPGVTTDPITGIPTDPCQIASNANAAGGGNAIVSNSNVAPIAWPSLGFYNNPGGKDPKAIALTFDDAPDGNGPNEWGKASPSNMAHVLDQLDLLKLKATFFLCAKTWTDAKNDPQAQADVKRMLAAGHAVASHTYTHPDLVPQTARNAAAVAAKTVLNPILTPAQIASQFTDNESAFADPRLLGPSFLPFTMYRSPFGYPFQSGIVYPPNETSIAEDVTGVAPYTPYNAVHVGWAIDTKDWDCAQNNKGTDCLLQNMNNFLKKGANGVVLMHAVYKQTGDALPQIVKMIQDYNLHIVQVEDLIVQKYGATSADIYKANINNPKPFDTKAINDAAVAEAKLSKWYLGKNEG